MRFVFVFVVFLAENGIHITEHHSALQKTTQITVPDLGHLGVQGLRHFGTIEELKDFPQEKVTAGHFLMFGAEEQGRIVDLKRIERGRAFEEIQRRTSLAKCRAASSYSFLAILN